MTSPGRQNLDRLVDYSGRLPRSGPALTRTWETLHSPSRPVTVVRVMDRAEDTADSLLGRLPKIAPPISSSLLESEAKVDGTPVFFRFSPGAGDHQPAMIHVHGFGISGTYLLPTAGLLAEEFRTYVPDLPGYGRSGNPRRTLGITGLADAVAGFMDSVGLERATLVGNSMGSAVTAEFVARHRDRIDRAVLVSPAGGQHNQPLSTAMKQMLLDGLREPPRMVPVAIPDYVRFGLLDSLRLFRAMTRFPVLERLLTMDVPTLGVLGARDPLMPPTSRVQEVVDQMAPTITVVRLQGVAHAANFSHPDLVAHVIRCFMHGEPVTQYPGAPGAIQVGAR